VTKFIVEWSSLSSSSHWSVCAKTWIWICALRFVHIANFRLWSKLWNCNLMFLLLKKRQKQNCISGWWNGVWLHLMCTGMTCFVFSSVGNFWNICIGRPFSGKICQDHSLNQIGLHHFDPTFDLFCCLCCWICTYKLMTITGWQCCFSSCIVTALLGSMWWFQLKDGENHFQNNHPLGWTRTLRQALPSGAEGFVLSHVQQLCPWNRTQKVG